MVNESTPLATPLEGGKQSFGTRHQPSANRRVPRWPAKDGVTIIFWSPAARTKT